MPNVTVPVSMLWKVTCVSILTTTAATEILAQAQYQEWRRLYPTAEITLTIPKEQP